MSKRKFYKLISSCILAIFIIFLVSGCNFRSFSIDKPIEMVSANSNEIDDPVAVVKQLWNHAQSGDKDNAVELLTFTPLSFYDDEPRCPPTALHNRNDGNLGKDEALAVIESRRDWGYDASLKMIDQIQTQKVQLEKVDLERSNKNEAVIKVIYKYNESAGVKIRVQTYFLLSRSDKKWMVFLVAANPWTFNNNYANPNCE